MKNRLRFRIIHNYLSPDPDKFRTEKIIVTIIIALFIFLLMVAATKLLF